MIRIFLGSLLWMTISLAADPFIDLESELRSDFVLETKKIDIPAYPNAFNASLIRWKGSLLMSFRILPNPLSSFTSWLGLTWLDEDFHPIGKPQLLQTRDKYSLVPSRAEDARLFTIGNRLYIAYSDNPDRVITRGGFRMYFRELCYDGSRFSLKDAECLTRFEEARQDIREKNWVPFDYKGTLLFAYSILPHRILHPLFGTGECETVASTLSSLPWEWGLPRGGTPGLPEGDEYLAFFHSSKDLASVHSDGKKMTHYFIGAYTFANSPPFTVLRCSRAPIIGKGFYSGATYKPYWKPVCVVFPCGYISNNQYIWITYGRQDHEIGVAKIDKKALLASLIPVAAIE